MPKASRETSRSRRKKISNDASCIQRPKKLSRVLFLVCLKKKKEKTDAHAVGSKSAEAHRNHIARDYERISTTTEWSSDLNTLRRLYVLLPQHLNDRENCTIFHCAGITDVSFHRFIIDLLIITRQLSTCDADICIFVAFRFTYSHLLSADHFFSSLEKESKLEKRNIRPKKNLNVQNIYINSEIKTSLTVQYISIYIYYSFRKNDQSHH